MATEVRSSATRTEENQTVHKLLFSMCLMMAAACSLYSIRQPTGQGRQAESLSTARARQTAATQWSPPPQLIELPTACRSNTRQIRVQHTTADACSAILPAEQIKYSPFCPPCAQRKGGTPPAPHTRRYSSCAIVSNGGVLLGTGCGTSIDRNEAVFRVNTPILSGFESDVGSRTTHRLLNTPETRRHAWNSVRFKSDVVTVSLISAHLKKEIKSYWNVSGIERVWRPNNGYRRDLKRFWRAHNSTMRETAGLQSLMHAASLCDLVNMYGFTDPRPQASGESPPYHFWWKPGQVHDDPRTKPPGTIRPSPRGVDALRFGDPFGAGWHDWGLEHRLMDEMAEAGRQEHGAPDVGICVHPPPALRRTALRAGLHHA
jgi:hypothetical protein